LPTADFGIDGHLEVVRRDGSGDGRATGWILSAQIKTGASYFGEDKGDHWLVRIKKSIVAYWRSHSVPVILILVDPSTRICYWARGDAEHHTEFETTFGVAVPKSRVLNDSAAHALEQLAENVAPAGSRLAMLEGAVPWMEMLRRGERLYLSVDEWVNKSSGRMDVSIGTYVEEEVKVASYAYSETKFKPMLEFGTMGFGSWREVVRRQFPWAKLVPDEHAQPDEDELHDAYLNEHGAWDHEDGRYFDYKGEFTEYRDAAMNAWRDGFIGEFGSGEVFSYRMELKLNHLGRAFLRVNDYLASGPVPVTET
jgi:hypothetical protein